MSAPEIPAPGGRSGPEGGADLAELAERLDDAARRATAIPQLAAEAAIDVGEAYDVQALNVARRLSRGERLVGVKMGFTSRAKMIQMGLSDLIWGRLTSGMRLEDGGEAEFARYVHPRIEPEIAFLLKAPLSGDVSPAEAAAAVEAVAPAMELIDSRYRDFKFTLPDVVADNASSGAFVTGPVALPADGLDLAMEAVMVEVDGAIVDSATGAAVQGHPAEALALAVNDLGRRGKKLEAGWIVLTGGMTDAVFAPPGSSVACHFTSLGSVYLNGGPAAEAGTGTSA